MFTVARLKDVNKRVGYKMRTYTSANGNRFNAGTPQIPAAWKIIRDPNEANELREIPQFQVLEIESQTELDEMIQRDMEVGVSKGKAPVRAAVIASSSTTKMDRVSDDAKRSAALKDASERAASILRPTPIVEKVSEHNTSREDETKDIATVEAPARKAKATTPKPSGRRGRSSKKTSS